MSGNLGKLKFKIAVSVAVLVAGLAMSTGVATAQKNPSSQEILNALKPKAPLTRSLATSPAEQAKRAEEGKFIDSLRNRPTRSLSTDERQQIATVSAAKPRIDLEVKFDFNSAEIAKSAITDVNNLGKALSDPDLKGSTFVLAGHTDVAPVHQDDNLKDHSDNWLKCMRSRAKPNGSIETGFAHAVAVVMATRSYREGKKLYWDRKTEEIVSR